MSLIEVHDLCKSFGSLNVLQNVNLNVEAGERIAIIGGSGCGKSVFLRSLELLEKPDHGRIFIDGDEITAKGADIDRIRQSMGMVYQKFHLFSPGNAAENAAVIFGYQEIAGFLGAFGMECLDMIEIISRQGFIHAIIIVYMGIQHRCFRIDI